jgi:hypothetical protein
MPNNVYFISDLVFKLSNERIVRYIWGKEHFLGFQKLDNSNNATNSSNS